MQQLQTSPSTAVIWAIGGSKPGDNSQLRRAVDAMNMPYSYKSIVLKPGANRRNPFIRPTVSHVDAAASSPLGPPWPDLVVTVGRHLSCVALWIKQQSGGKTRIALINAPRGRAADFDLVLLCSLYQMDDHPNVLRYRFPLTSLPGELAQQPVAKTGGAPLHVLLLGGPTKDFRLDAAAATGILGAMRKSHARGGRVAIVTSRRTPRRAIDALERHLMAGDTLYRWKANDTNNPYRAIIAQGDTFTVTGDSLSMLVDVASQGKTLIIAPLPRKRLATAAQSLAALARKFLARFPALSLVHAVDRDFDRFQQVLISEGYAVPLGHEPVPPACSFPDESALVADGLKRLLTHVAPLPARTERQDLPERAAASRASTERTSSSAPSG